MKYKLHIQFSRTSIFKFFIDQHKITFLIRKFFLVKNKMYVYYDVFKM